jgi:hypothetical protein
MPNDTFSHLEIQPRLTRLIELGDSEEEIRPASRIIPTVTAPFGTQTLQYPEYGRERFQEHDTRRGPGQEFGRSEFTFTTRTVQTQRHGWSIMVDWETLPSANPILQLAGKISGWPRRVVLRDLEGIKTDFLLDASNYEVGHEITIPATEEWDTAGGDPRGVVAAGYTLINNVTGVQPDRVRLFLPFESSEALRSSPEWEDFLKGGGVAAKPSLQAASDFLGIGEVWTANYRRLDNATGDLVSAFGDIGILYVLPGDLTGHDVVFGSRLPFAVDWEARPPFASQVIQMAHRTSTMWAWSQYSLVTSIVPGAAVIIRNISSLV